jgi:acetyltransferase
VGRTFSGDGAPLSALAAIVNFSGQSMKALLEPRAIAVVGASQRAARGTDVIVNLQKLGFAGEIYAVNPRYQDVLGYTCYPTVSDLPDGVDCLVIAVGANAACDVLEEAHGKGIRAAVVLTAGFGEGGVGETRVRRLQSLAAKGMCICGPNCFGLINLKSKTASFSGPLSPKVRTGNVALVSQSGGLGASAFTPLAGDRGIGFAYFVSCGNQLGATIEDFADYFVDDPDVEVIAIVIEALKNPQKLVEVARKAHAARKSLLLYQAGRSATGQVMIRSHTGALASNAEVLAAFLRRCGIVQIKDFDEFVETIALFAIAPRDQAITDDVIVVSGSGGNAAIATDVLEDAGVVLAEFEPETKQRLRDAQPEFGSVTNPIDGTGAMYDDPEHLPKIFAALTAEHRRPAIAASVNVRSGGAESMRRLTDRIVDAARSSGRTFLAFQYSPLGGPLDTELIEKLHATHVPVLLGVSNAMRSLRYLPIRRNYWARGAPAPATPRGAVNFDAGDFLSVRKALTAAGVPVVDAALARSEAEAVAVQQRFGVPVAIKAEVPGLLHKSDVGGVHLGCDGADAVTAAYRQVIQNVRNAGFKTASQVLIQPMISGGTEVYAGIIDDALFGPAICFGLGGIFIEIFNDARTEMAPLSRADALSMIHAVKGAKLLTGVRGRKAGDIEALADLLVNLGQFAVMNAGKFRSLDLNPIIVKAAGEGAIAVDIAVETSEVDAAGFAAHAAS